MFKNVIFFGVMLVACSVFGQEGRYAKSEFNFRDGVHSAEFGLTTKLSERWTLHQNVALFYNNDASRFSLPVFFRYKITNQLSVFGGVNGYRVANTPSFNTIAPMSKLGVGSLLGIEVEFSEKLFFNAALNTNFSMDKNSLLMGLENNRSGATFNFGYSF
ncbi:hypothetical protein MWU59_01580 [Flavobacteriaceae bacterium F08102]|nr:hypothetical protein [Flavobacteriaceae bacterium F08102]